MIEPTAEEDGALLAWALGRAVETGMTLLVFVAVPLLLAATLEVLAFGEPLVGAGLLAATAPVWLFVLLRPRGE
jgi:hypothetical protein